MSPTKTLERSGPVDRARGLLAGTPLCDILFAASPWFKKEIELFRAEGFSYVSLTVAADDAAAPAVTYPRLAMLRHTFDVQPEKYILADGVDDIRRAHREGKVAIGFHFQGTEAIGRDLANVGAYYKLGVRWMLLAYNFQNNAGMGCIEARQNDLGLSSYGRTLIAEMNRVGMIVDLSHSGYRTTMDAMAASTAPCIFSHSNPLALFEHPRNITDDQIRTCAAMGGVIGINGVGSFIGEPHKITVEKVFRNLDYVAQLVGVEHICLGIDYMSPEYCQSVADRFNGDLSKVGMAPLPWGMMTPSQTLELINVMLNHGYSEDNARGVMGENFLRVASGIWK